VVITFDDGPLPPRSTHVLDILEHECVKATFFLIGKNGAQFPRCGAAHPRCRPHHRDS